MEATPSSNLSLVLTFSGFNTSDISQNNISPPEKRKNVSASGSITEGINILATGLLTPKIIFAASNARCPATFGFFKTLFFYDAKVLNFGETPCEKQDTTSLTFSATQKNVTF